ncbi:MAG: dUTP diphosphatase [Candidatus Woesearchaeota archaeon]
MKKRGFEKVSRVKNNKNYVLPKRSTKFSAGYDFFLHCNIEILPGKKVVVATGVKSYFLKDEALFIYPRSGLGFKFGVMLANTVGIIDADYYNNSNNEGEIFVKLVNTSNKTVKLNKNDKFCQAVFQKFLLVDNDDVKQKRNGGMGSTGQ